MPLSADRKKELLKTFATEETETTASTPAARSMSPERKEELLKNALQERSAQKEAYTVDINEITPTPEPTPQAEEGGWDLMSGFLDKSDVANVPRQFLEGSMTALDVAQTVGEGAAELPLGVAQTIGRESGTEVGEDIAMSLAERQKGIDQKLDDRGLALGTVPYMVGSGLGMAGGAKILGSSTSKWLTKNFPQTYKKMQKFLGRTPEKMGPDGKFKDLPKKYTIPAGIGGAGALAYTQGRLIPVTGGSVEEQREQAEANAETAMGWGAGIDATLRLVPYGGRFLKKIISPTDKDVLNTMADDFEVSVAKVNRVLEEEGKEPFYPHQALTDMERWLREVGRINKKYNANIVLSPEELAGSPYVTSFLRQYGKATGKDVAEMIGTRANQEEYARILSSNVKQVDEDIRDAAKDMLSKRNEVLELNANEIERLKTEHDTLLEQAREARPRGSKPTMSKVTADTPDVGMTPEMAAASAVGKLRQADEEARSVLTQRYNDIEGAIQETLSPEEVSGYIKQMLGSAKDPYQRATMENILKGSVFGKDVLKYNPKKGTVNPSAPVGYGSIKRFTKSLGAMLSDTSSVVDADTINDMKKFWAGSKDGDDLAIGGVMGDLLSKNPKAAKEYQKLTSDYADYKSFGRGKLTNDEEAQAFKIALSDIQDARKGTDLGAKAPLILNRALKNKKIFDNVVEKYPDTIPDIQQYVIASLPASARSKGVITLSQVQTIRETYKDVLQSPSMKPLDKKLADLGQDIKTRGEKSIAEYNESMDTYLNSKYGAELIKKRVKDKEKAYKVLQARAKEDGLEDLSKALENRSNLFKDVKQAGQLLELAKKTNTVTSLRNIYRDEILDQAVSNVGGKVTVDNSADVLENMFDYAMSVSKDAPKTPERDIYLKIFGKEDQDLLRDVKRVMDREANAGKIKSSLDAVEKAKGKKERAVLETFLIATGIMGPAETTRAGAILKYFNQEKFGNMAQNLTTNPEAMADFLRLASDPTRKNLSQFAKYAEQSKPFVSAPIASRIAQDSSEKRASAEDYYEGVDINTISEEEYVPSESIIQRIAETPDEVKEVFLDALQYVKDLGGEPDSDSEQSILDTMWQKFRDVIVSPAEGAGILDTHKKRNIRTIEDALLRDEGTEFVSKLNKGESLDKPLKTSRVGKYSLVYPAHDKENFKEFSTALRSGNYVVFTTPEVAHNFIDKYSPKGSGKPSIAGEVSPAKLGGPISKTISKTIEALDLPSLKTKSGGEQNYTDLMKAFAFLESSFGKNDAAKDNPMQIMAGDGVLRNLAKSELGKKLNFDPTTARDTLEGNVQAAALLTEFERDRILGKDTPVDPHELYMLYSMGDAGFRPMYRAIKAGKKSQKSIDLVPPQNRPSEVYFYTKSGRPLTVAETEQKFKEKVRNALSEIQKKEYASL